MAKKDTVLPTGGQIIQRINVSDIEPDPEQPRKRFDTADIEATLQAKDGIATDERHDITHAIQLIMQPGGPPHRIKDGERRWRAAKNVGLLSLPAYFVAAADRASILEDQLRAGLTGQGLRPLEIADAIALRIAMGKRKPPSAEDLASRVGLSSARQVHRYRQLSTLAPEVRTALDAGEIEMSVALEIATVADPAKHPEVLAVVKGMSLRQARAEIRDRYHLQLVDCGFDSADKSLPGGSCSACPKNTAMQRSLWAEGEGAGLCTDKECFDAKRDWTWIALKNAALSRGAEVVEGEAAKKLIGHWGGGCREENLLVLESLCEKRGQRTWREVLGDVQPSMLVRDDRGRVHELVTLAEARTAAEKAGHVEIAKALAEDIEEQQREAASAEPSTPARTDEARKKELAAEREAEEALWARLRAAAAAAPLDAKLLRFLCGLVIREAEAEADDICESRGIEIADDGTKALLEHVATLNAPEALQAFLVELLLRVSAPRYATAENDLPARMAGACRFFGISSPEPEENWHEKAQFESSGEPPIVPVPALCELCGLRPADPGAHCDDCERLTVHILQLCTEKPRQGPQIKAASRDWHKDRVHAAIKHLTAAGKLDKDSSGFSAVRT